MGKLEGTSWVPSGPVVSTSLPYMMICFVPRVVSSALQPAQLHQTMCLKLLLIHGICQLRTHSFIFQPDKLQCHNEVEVVLHLEVIALRFVVEVGLIHFDKCQFIACAVSKAQWLDNIVSTEHKSVQLKFSAVVVHALVAYAGGHRFQARQLLLNNSGWNNYECAFACVVVSSW